MASQPAFTHIHCSSRFDRPADQFESDLDNWMKHSSLITVTEVNNDQRASQLMEKGWAHYNAKKGGGQDECAVAWRKDTWKATSSTVRKLNDKPMVGGRHWVWDCSVMLKHADSGHKLLVSVVHMPAGTNLVSGKNHPGQWEDRKKIYHQAMKAWHSHVLDLTKSKKPDAVMAIADFNLNLKADWAHKYLMDLWQGFGLGWTGFSGAGGSLKGGNQLPAGTPGKGVIDNVIDGTLYRGLEVTDNANLMNRVKSSDHRPYNETFKFNNDPGKGIKDGARDPVTGTTTKIDAWWGFGDYLDDEIYTYAGGVGTEDES